MPQCVSVSNEFSCTKAAVHSALRSALSLCRLWKFPSRYAAARLHQPFVPSWVGGRTQDASFCICAAGRYFCKLEAKGLLPGRKH